MEKASCKRCRSQQSHDFKSELVILSSSQSSHDESEDEKVQNYDSTASTPEVLRKVVHEDAKTERKASKTNSTADLGTNSAPPHVKTNSLPDLELTRVKKNPFCKPEEEDDNDIYLNYHPGQTRGNEGYDAPFEIPSWMPFTFRPPPAMKLNEICAYIAAYVFMPDAYLNGEEELIRSTKEVSGYRKTLKSLMPRIFVDQEVINLVVSRQNWVMDSLSKTNPRRVWYLPTSFAQIAIGCRHTPQEVRKIFQKDFIPKVQSPSKIFVPINDQGVHWYLMVVDFSERKLVVLDSLPCLERNYIRQREVLKLDIFIEEILSIDSVVDNVDSTNSLSNFCLISPRAIPTQRTGSNDCGVWVAKWMIECPFNSEYQKTNVVTASRMKLALHLVNSDNNTLFNYVVLPKAADYWKVQEKNRKALVKV
ncbi:Ulp1 protease family, carboxy-terminal domain protein [Medicago truncatula]|uniref:Ulp1 protease family, carboxy-terminal domain protein n=1 Tax=Medicago truncatula TaxID=3880 RepID=A0A072V4L1_MEDTR|nr:Ulp1 protease family, carboxy-terminal domain protein [Medicago truncatula]